MTQEEQLKAAYFNAINSGHKASRDRLKMAAFSYLETGQAPNLTARLAAKFKRSVKPFCDYIGCKHHNKGDGKQE